MPKILSDLWRTYRSPNAAEEIRSTELICIRCEKMGKQFQMRISNPSNFWTRTSNMTRHNGSFHNDTTISKSLRLVHQPVIEGSEREKQLHKLLAMAFTTSYIPTRFIENPHLKKAFHEYLNASLPSRKTLRKLYIENDQGKLIFLFFF